MIEPNILSVDDGTAVQAWALPDMSGVEAIAGRRVRRSRELEIEEDSIREQAKTDGRAEGLAQAQAEIDARMRQLDAQSALLAKTLAALARPLELVDAEVQRQLAGLALAVGAQLLRRELKADPELVIGIVKDTVGLLPAAVRDVRIQLHPADAALLRDRPPLSESGALWTFIEDPSLSRGDCRVIAESATVDARLESRLAAITEEVLAKHPEGEAPPPPGPLP
ncbi:MAG: hypothetical protein RLZZ200_884 [Pseudomonadota bacterium]|jgi:flagellar assembly protein FliH